MATATLEDRVTSLERRMSELEGQVGFLIPVVRQIHLDLLDFKEQVEGKLEAMDTKFTHRFNEMDAKFEAMPRAVAEVVADLLKK